MSSDFLFVTVPQTGHTLPLTSFAAELVRRGHRVRWYTGSRMADAVTATGAELLEMPVDLEPDQANLAATFPERASLKGLPQARFDLENIFVKPAGHHTKALAAMSPADVVVGDTWALAAPWLHELTGVRAATIGVNPLLFPSLDSPPAGLGMRPLPGPLNRVRNRLLNLMVGKVALASSVKVADDVRAGLGLPRAGRTPLVYAARTQLYLQLSPPGFEFPRKDLPGHVHFLGHPVDRKPATERPEWWGLLRGRKVVLVTQGTVATDPGSLLRPAIEALAGRDVVVIAVTGGAPTSVLGPLPGNVIAERFLPFDALLPHVHALVTNGGFGGVQRAIAHGVPLVVAGTSEDKKDVNARVAHSGVGVNLGTDTPTAAAIDRAVATVLGDTRFRQAVLRVRDSAAPGNPTIRGTDLLEELAVTKGNHEYVTRNTT
jgi:UDP:flavonoid glycosyltransferase YjiC (YdhE family)